MNRPGFEGAVGGLGSDGQSRCECFRKYPLGQALQHRTAFHILRFIDLCRLSIANDHTVTSFAIYRRLKPPKGGAHLHSNKNVDRTDARCKRVEGEEAI